MELLTVLSTRMDAESIAKLERLNNDKVVRFVREMEQLCQPDRIMVFDDSEADLAKIREEALRNGEEQPLALEGHTVHFDNYYDQARDKEHTKILLPDGKNLGTSILTGDREEGLAEIREIMQGIMKGKTMYVRFFCLGPTNSDFSIPCVQITDSAYVAHSEDILYRQGYEEMLRQGPDADFFRFVHSQGELDENHTSKNLDKRRVYIDLEDALVYSANTQYGGNTLGLKKLAMRLAIYKGYKEGWLTEHMLVMGVHGPNDRVTYFTGAFPSMCGKTSTAMMEGETIVGDDIAYLRRKNGEVWAVNVESGIFGIIQGVNSKDDPIQWEALHSPNEIIFSNVLVTEDKQVYWVGKDGEVPRKGINHSGEWYLGKKDAEGKEIPPSHPNARFTISLKAMKNLDPRAEDPNGVRVDGIVYGGRDTDTSVPVEQAFDWEHGIITKGASLESETTAATLGKAGVRKFNPMSNLDFLSIPVGEYIKSNLDFGKKLTRPPMIFSVNYFLTDPDGRWLNGKNDKKVWYKWMERRIHGEVDAIKTPTGYIPLYEDLQQLFADVLDKEYTEQDYNEQFKLRVPENLAKIERIKNIYREIDHTPEILFNVLDAQKERLLEIQKKLGEYILPAQLA
ncbi:MAG: phosphoenolpyruvate carboxykinase (GTP) [Calditrichia bacterium]